MRTSSEPRFLATAISLSVVALGGASLLTSGCGSGGGTSTTPAPITAASGASTSYAGRSYTVDNIALADGRTGSLALQVSSGSSIVGVLKLTNPTDTVGLTGTVTPATGAFVLHGNLTRAASDTATDAATRASGDPVVVKGTLPSGNSDGNLTLTVGGQTVNAALRGPGASPSPSPSASGSPGASPTPSPSGSATPNPTPSANPTPNPTPSTGPGSGSGTLGDYLNGFVSSANDTFNFQYTSQDTASPDPNGNNEGPTSGTNSFTGAISAFGVPVGPKDTVTIQLPLSGSKTVTREALLNPKTGKAVSYDYYVDNASGRTDYGSDSVDANGKINSSTRYEGGPGGGGSGTLPYNLSVGQSFSSTYTDYETDYDETGAVTSQSNYSETDKLTFVGIETVTVAAGTFTSVAHLHSESAYTLPVNGGTPAQPNSDTSEFYVSKYAGRVLAKFHNVTQNNIGSFNGSNYTYTDTFDGTNQLASATVNGTNYPPGRAAMSFGQRSNLTFGKALAKHSALYRFGVR